MKKQRKGKLLLLLFVSIVLFGAGISQMEAKSASTVTLKKLTLKIGSKNVTKKNYRLTKGKTVRLKASVTPKEIEVSIRYKSDNKKVVQVNQNGTLTAKKPGTAKIQVTAAVEGEKSKSTYVTVQVIQSSENKTASGGKAEETSKTEKSEAEKPETERAEAEKPEAESSKTDYQAESSEVETSKTDNQKGKETMIQLQIGDHVLTATLEQNSSAEALVDLLKEGPMTIEMDDYANMEKVGSLPQSLPRNDKQISVGAGDLILYLGSSITIYYDTNSWNFTKLGKINDISQKDLKELLGKGSVRVIFSLPEA